ncbi:hypothetical protein A2645_02300 [Candidatus Nomurabacteria bacterium RIFCSPHIGHO2_01_FULL_39_9]|uniref:Adenylate kinase n=1 Tax=Candidatus Nomurabacteria bacterium RIFCSPHIGHO2_01_FULL_39_9 TaxID=1801735 RepID=A0A1F6UV19_9BACT|nr:MAG: hypothetical protein A2645_02300 [Candidatus Nomurabacteria bacterium RIFCSPHIGHO2_01_FULL_39_9]
MKKAFVLIGAPGSGKGTQAEVLAKRFKVVHFETSKILERKLKKPKTKELKEAKKLYDTGKLVTPTIVAKVVLEEIRNLCRKGLGVVFSGSPRMLAEAKIDIPILEQCFGKKNIFVFYIKLTKRESVRRNSVRKICVANRHPIPFVLKEFKNVKKCPWDGSKIVSRSLDKPKMIAKRYDVFLKDTKPVIKYFKDNKFIVRVVDGEQSIEKVHKDIIKAYEASKR